MRVAFLASLVLHLLVFIALTINFWPRNNGEPLQATSVGLVSAEEFAALSGLSVPAEAQEQSLDAGQEPSVEAVQPADVAPASLEEVVLPPMAALEPLNQEPLVPDVRPEPLPEAQPEPQPEALSEPAPEVPAATDTASAPEPEAATPRTEPATEAQPPALEQVLETVDLSDSLIAAIPIPVEKPQAVARAAQTQRATRPAPTTPPATTPPAPTPPREEQVATVTPLTPPPVTPPPAKPTQPRQEAQPSAPTTTSNATRSNATASDTVEDILGSFSAPEPAPAPRPSVDSVLSSLQGITPSSAGNTQTGTTGSVRGEASAANFSSADFAGLTYQINSNWAYPPSLASDQGVRIPVRIYFTPTASVVRIEALEPERLNDPAYRLWYETFVAAIRKSDPLLLPSQLLSEASSIRFVGVPRL